MFDIGFMIMIKQLGMAKYLDYNRVYLWAPSASAYWVVGFIFAYSALFYV